MGLMDIFKSKSSSPEPDAKLRWFGKLPTYADYYSSKGNEDWTVEFDEWVLKGYEIYHAKNTGSSREERQIPICGCAIRLPKSRMTVFASVQDYGGDMRGRPFPICFYTGVPSKEWPGPSSSSLPPAVDAVADLMALKHDVIRFFKAPGRFDQEFGEREVDLAPILNGGDDDSWLNSARSIDMQEWFNLAVGGMKIKSLPVWLKHVQQFGRSIAEHDSADFEPTLRFPLARSISSRLQVCGWLRWLESRMSLSKRSMSMLVAGDTDEGTATLSIVLRELMPNDFLLLTPIAGTLTFVDDMTRLSAEEDEYAEGDNVPATWADFVTALR